MDVVNVGASPGGEGFLLITEEKVALLDTGFTFCAKGMVRKIKESIGDRNVDFIILTHSHYDHVGGASLVKETWPDAKIISAKHAAEVFEKPNAIATMKKLNRAAAWELRKKLFVYSGMDHLHTDIIVKEGDIIDLGSVKFKVMDAPGHTWDTIAFWSEEEKFLITNETMGVPTIDGNVMPACLVSYKKAMEYILRAQELRPQKMLIAHYAVVDAEEAAKILEMSRYWNQYCRDMIMGLHEEGKDIEEIKLAVKNKFYTENVRKGQPEKAFDLNNKYYVPNLIKECSSERTQ